MARRRTSRHKQAPSGFDVLVPVVALFFLVVYVYTRRPSASLVILYAALGLAGVVGWFIWRDRRRTGAFEAFLQERVEPVIGAPAPWPALNQDHQRDELYDTWKQSSSAGGSITATPDRWTLDLLRTLEWKRFEDVCSSLFENLGFITRTTRRGADGGVDVHIYKTSTDRADAIVQCKAWNTYRVGIKPVRELLGVMASTGVPEGIFMTTGTFTREARDFGHANRIDCMDGEAVLKAITTLQAAQQDAMLRMATEGDYLTPTCASCGIKLVRREPKGGGQAFWGCSNFPRCKLTMAMR
jgi:hypothetical protein